MEFLDRSGHIFSIDSYNDKPIGYEFDESKYIFWFDTLGQTFLSINNYYIQTIYALISIDDFINLYNINTDYIAQELSISLECTSNIYKLLPAYMVQDLVNGLSDINEVGDKLFINIKDDDMYTSLSSDNNDTYKDVDKEHITLIVTSEENSSGKPSLYAILPIYVLAKSIEEGSWTNSILLHVKSENKELWCPITVGGEFQEQYEELVINGKNMGIELPKGILKSIYQNSFYNSSFNEELYNEKLKEYLINYMNIRGNQGNYQSIKNSLNWFGWGDKIKLNKLLEIDNEYKKQFLIHNFNVYDNNLLYSYRQFIQSLYIKLYVELNMLAKDDEGNIIYNEQNFDEVFVGEGNPVLKTLDNEYKFNYIGLGDDNNYHLPDENKITNRFAYIKKYYDFTINELGLKLVSLCYYLKNYFLPLHINIHGASLQYKVFANDIKYSNKSFVTEITNPLIIEDSDVSVTFPHNGYYYFTKQTHLVDQYFNEFNGYGEYDNAYYLNDTCVNIPIIVDSKTNIVDKTKNSKFYNCVLILEKEKLDKDNYKYNYRINEVMNIFNNTITLYDSHNKLYHLYTNKDEYKFGYGYLFNYKNVDGIMYPITYFESFTNIYKDILSNYSTIFDINIHTEYSQVESADELYVDANIYDKTISLLYEDEYEIDSSSYHVVLMKDNGNEYVLTNNLELTGDNILPYDFTFTIPEINSETNEKLDMLYYVWDFKDDKYCIVIKETDFDDNYHTRMYNILLNELNPKLTVRVNVVPYCRLFVKSNNIIKNVKLYDIVKLNKYIDTVIENKLYNINESTTRYQMMKYIIDNNIYNSYVKELMYERNDTLQTEIVYVSHFSYYQTEDHKYMNFILCPKYFNTDHSYFERCKLIIKLLVNNKWFYHEFYVKMQELIVDLGRLEYNYYKNYLMLDSMFSQIEYIDDNCVHFNANIYEPGLVTINSSTFVKDIISHYYNDNIIYVNINDYNYDNKYYILYKDYKIFIDSSLIGNDFNIKIEDIEDNMIIVSKEVCLYYIINDIYSIKICKPTNEFLGVLSFIYNKETKQYIIDNNEDNPYTIYTNIENKSLIDTQYTNRIQIPLDNKYKNNILLFDIYKNTEHKNDILKYHNNIHLSVNGLMFNKQSSENVFEIGGRVYNRSDINDLANVMSDISDSSLTDYESIDIQTVKINHASNLKDLREQIDDLVIDKDLYGNWSIIQDTTKSYIYYYDQYENAYVTGSSTQTSKTKDIEIFTHKYANKTEFENELNDKNSYLYSEIQKLNTYNTQFEFVYDDVLRINNFEIYLEKNNIYKSLNNEKVVIKYDESIIDVLSNHEITIHIYVRVNYNLIENIISQEDYNNKIDDTVKQYCVEYTGDNYHSIQYTEIYNEKNIKNNPGLFWWQIDIENIHDYNIPNNNNYDISDVTYNYNVNSNLSEIYIKDAPENDTNFRNLEEMINDVKNENYVKYRNYLEYHIEGKTGNFVTEYKLYQNGQEIEDNDFLTLYIKRIEYTNEQDFINKENGIEQEAIQSQGSIFTIDNPYNEMYVYIKINNEKLYEDNNPIDFDDMGYSFEAHVYQLYNKYDLMKYESNTFKLVENNNSETLDIIKIGIKDKIIWNNSDTYKQNIIKLYNKFFEKKNLQVTKNSEYVYWDKKDWLNDINNKNKLADYDFYLMHDYDQWYGIYISKETNNSFLYKPISNYKQNIMSDDKEFKLCFVRADNRFLINRYKFISSEGNNIFNNKDIICAKIVNNDRISTNMMISSKWNVHYASLSNVEPEEFNSNTETTIINIPSKNNEYVKGYYDIDVRYTIDNNTNQQYKTSNTFVIR